VLGALEYAKELGAVTGAISCNRNSRTFEIAKHRLFVNVGSEVVTGSTRMKSGTAQKLILNMISTASMIRLGKVYRNLMVDLKPVNHKLVLCSIRLIREVTGCSEEKAREAFESSACGSVKNPKAAIVMVLLGKTREEAPALLEKSGGHISAPVRKEAGAE
jgi:N-acetylmuramic acid 6-phosphate etherase